MLRTQADPLPPEVETLEELDQTSHCLDLPLNIHQMLAIVARAEQSLSGCIVLAFVVASSLLKPGIRRNFNVAACGEGEKAKSDMRQGDQGHCAE